MWSVFMLTGVTNREHKNTKKKKNSPDIPPFSFLFNDLVIQ